ncbi:putative transport accessory protein MmpS2 [Nocardia cerradoensis]|uniref:Putative transport accessory protein MmpS2 n=1 Tax=Nocardia cerradoensis TaxID=85688 RepID=A0A231GVT8_9NOCA|nr:MmpS family transport accessory protein [Nocardia cerradoensis]OXR40743.1 putative transport accessory protein MmpS2 [Nocardia cerradoensis]
MTNPPNAQQNPYPPGPPPGYYQPPKKRKKWPWVLGGILVLFVVLLGSCMALVGGVAHEVDKESKREVTVTYQVEGTSASSSITYSGRDFNIAQETDATLPWSKQVTIDGLGKTVSLSATTDEQGGDITCRVLVGDKVISEQKSSGPFASAHCTGDAGQK